MILEWIKDPHEIISCDAAQARICCFRYSSKETSSPWSLQRKLFLINDPRNRMTFPRLHERRGNTRCTSIASSPLAKPPFQPNPTRHNWNSGESDSLSFPMFAMSEITFCLGASETSTKNACRLPDIVNARCRLSTCIDLLKRGSIRSDSTT